MKVAGKVSALYGMTKYLGMKRPYRLEKPIVIQFPVIDICNSRCQMCRIWENHKSTDITPDQLRKGLRNPLYSEVTSVGLNGGEPTLRKDLGKLAEVLFEELPKLRAITLITNAFKTDEVIARITDVGLVARKHGGRLSVMVSLDGYGEVHDRVRGKPGNFERAKKVIAFLRTCPDVASIRIGCTIIRENVYGLEDLLEYCIAEGLEVKYRLGVPHQRLYTQDLRDPYALSFEQKYHVAEFIEGLTRTYETNPRQNFFYRSLIDQIIREAPRKAGCDWQHRGATITAKGELLYCAVQSKVLGKIAEDDSHAIYFGNQSHLDDILATQCDSCHHDYVGIPPKGVYAREVTGLLAGRFRLTGVVNRVTARAARHPLRLKRYFTRKLARIRAAGGMPTPWPRKKGRTRVLICGWYGTETLGDKAILAGIAESLRAALGEIDLAVVALNRYVTEMTRRQMPELSDMTILSPEEGVRIAGSADLVAFGGGPIMAIDELAEMQAIFEAARAKGVKTLVAGAGVGPLGADWHNRAIADLLRLADHRIYRDGKSRDAAAAMGIDVAGDIVAEDPAFTWLAAQRKVLPRPVPAAGARKVLLLGLRDFPYKAYARDLPEAECLAAKARYEAAVIATLETLTARHPDLVIRPLPMCTQHFGGDDRWFYRRLFRGNAALAGRLDLSLLGEEFAPEAYARAFREADAALTMRFHSLVFALGLETPAFAIDYTLGRGKVRALAERFGVPQQSLLDLDAETMTEALDRLLREGRPQAPGFAPEFAAAVAGLLPDRPPPARKDEQAA